MRRESLIQGSLTTYWLLCTSDGVHAKEMTSTPQCSTEPHNLTIINVPNIQSPRSSSEVMRAETEAKSHGIVDYSINTFIRSRRSSSESTRVQEWTNNQRNVDSVSVKFSPKRFLELVIYRFTPSLLTQIDLQICMSLNSRFHLPLGSGP